MNTLIKMIQGNDQYNFNVLILQISPTKSRL
jgi:hypothetical protein